MSENPEIEEFYGITICWGNLAIPLRADARAQLLSVFECQTHTSVEELFSSVEMYGSKGHREVVNLYRGISAEYEFIIVKPTKQNAVIVKRVTLRNLRKKLDSNPHEEMLIGTSMSDILAW